MSDATPERFVVASANPDKVLEIRAILTEVLGDDAELLARPSDVPDVEETGTTLLDNARLKAVALAQATGVASIADDTGLFVAALRGEPGVYSARYAGENASYADNVAKLLDCLQSATDRRAEFRTVAIAVFPDGTEVIAEGVVQGTIARVATGTGGFGYDPIFVPDEGVGRSFGEMDAAEKHAISHRGRAFRALGEMVSKR